MEDWIIGLVLALFITGVFLAAILRWRGLQRQVAGWPELAARTGLIYTPATSSLSPPSVRGEYRGRYLSMDLIMIGDPDHIGIPNQNTSISLDVEKPYTFSLSMQAKTGFNRLATYKVTHTGNQEFNRCFIIKGWPTKYAQTAASLITRSDPHLLAWMIRNRPSIELKAGTLVCRQNGELTDLHDQVALLDLLCNLAELTERTGSKAVTGSDRRMQK